MIVALNQSPLTTSGFQAGLEAMEKTIQQNIAEGAKLCIFSEDFLYGILRGKPKLIQAGKQFDRNVEKVKQLARKYQVDIIPGSLPRYYKSSVFNSTVYVDKTGDIRTQYSKHNLWLSERQDFTPSLEPLQIFDSVLGKTAIIICWDLIDHTLFKEAVRQGAHWVICLSFWMISQTDDLRRTRGEVKTQYHGFSDANFLDILIPARCMEYNVGILFCNFSGTHEYTGDFGTIQRGISAGRTQVITPLKHVSASIRNGQSKTLLTDINTSSELRLFQDMEIWYGRHEDILHNYPYGQ